MPKTKRKRNWGLTDFELFDWDQIYRGGKKNFFFFFERSFERSSNKHKQRSKTKGIPLFIVRF